MEKAREGIGVPIYDPQGKFLGHVTVNKDLEVSHSLQLGYSIDRKESEIKKLNREISGLKRDIIYANNNYHSNLSKIKILFPLMFIFIMISIIYGVIICNNYFLKN